MRPARTTRLRRHISPSNLVATGAILLAGCSVLSACGSDNDGNNVPDNTKPTFAGKVTTSRYDGVLDGLLTAGPGASGLISTTAPTTANLTASTVAELRRLAIYADYRALVSTAAKGGYGTLYGPNVDASGNITQGSGMVPGTEYVTHPDDGTGQQDVVLLVQIPDSFSVNNPYIIAATSSSPRGIYGVISTSEQGLRRKCAVAYTDKNTGAGPHDLAIDTVALQDGTRVTRSAAGLNMHFAIPLTSSQPAALNTAMPNRLAFKHAYSQRSPEKDQGPFTLQAVQFAFWMISDKIAGAGGALTGSALSVRPDNTTVIASNTSNSGGAAIAAAEQDTDGWIDGVAVGEPGLNLPSSTGVQMVCDGTTLPTADRPLFDYVNYVNVFRLCAVSSVSVVTAPAQAFFGSLMTFPASAQANRYTALRAAGPLTSTTTAAQADEILQKMRTYGWEPEPDLVCASMSFYEIDPSVSATFGNALLRANVTDSLCRLSFAATDTSFHPTVANATALAQVTTVGNGIPPISGAQLVNNNAQGGPMQSNQLVGSTGTQAANLDGTLCLRNLLTGADTASQSPQAGIRQTLRTGNLRDKPALIVQGRNGTLLPVNHDSRPYLRLSAKVEDGSSELSCIEVTNTQHFDGFTDLVPGYDTLSVPLALYEQCALDAMYADLKNGIPLPPSQVVYTTPHGGAPGATPATNTANLPNFAGTPATGDRISVGVLGGVATVLVPN